MPEQGIDYRQIEFEVNASGNVTLVRFSSQHRQRHLDLKRKRCDILAANTARLATGDGTLDVDFLASTQGRVKVTLIDATTVATIAVHDATMVEGASSPVVPVGVAQIQRDLPARSQRRGPSLDVATVSQHDGWFIPLGGSQTVTLSGNAGLVELHPESPVTVKRTGSGRL